jgi:hypothetical protein
MVAFSDLPPEQKAQLRRWLSLFYAKLGSLAVHGQSLSELDAEYQAAIAPVLGSLDSGTCMPDVAFRLTKEQVGGFMSNVESILTQLEALPELTRLYKRES